MRLGIFGGTFDPVHQGHLLLAEASREQCGLDWVWFLPAASAPHKQQLQTTDASHRIAMLELAIAGNDAFSVCSIEIDRGGVSYTVETLRTITAQHPGTKLFFLMGADSLHDLPNWREPAEVCALATPLVVRRAGQDDPDFKTLLNLVDAQRVAHIKRHLIDMPRIELASSDMRQRVTDGKSIRYQTPRAVEMYIRTHRLYAATPPITERETL